MTGDKAFAEALRAEGVRYVFGLPGGHSVRILYDKLAETEGIDAVLMRHETAGAFAALGYAQISGHAAVCHGTAGPGWSQTIVGVHESLSGRIPMVCIAAAAPIATYGKGALQEFRQIENMVACTKWAYRVDRAQRIPWAVQQAFKHAFAPPPGPAFLDVPIDVPGETIDAEPYRPAPRPRSQADDDDVERAAEMLIEAKRPIIVAGRGVHQARAWDELRELAELLTIPVLHTNHGKSAIPESHPLSAGGVGVNRTLVSSAILERSDCWFWIGSQIEEFAVGRWEPLPPERRFIHADADSGNFAKNWNPDVALLGDAQLVLRQLIAPVRDRIHGKQTGMQPDAPIVQEIAQLRARYAERVQAQIDASEGPVHPAQLLAEVQRQKDDDAIIVLGEGASRVWTATELKIDAPGHWVSASDFGCMGYAVPAAIGAKLAKPECQVISITGDGSFQMQMQELPVAAQHSAPVTWIVMNNNCLGWIKWGQKVRYDERYYAVDFAPNWRHDLAAEAAGCHGERVESPEQLEAAISAALRANAEGQSAVVEVLTPQTEQTDGFVQHHGVASE
jgi:acetolactate synthase-1/2/3 large subunit